MALPDIVTTWLRSAVGVLGCLAVAACSASTPRTRTPNVTNAEAPESTESGATGLCRRDLDALRNLVGQNYAGMADKPGKEALEAATTTARQQLRTVADARGCTDILTAFVATFGDRHLWLFDADHPPPNLPDIPAQRPAFTPVTERSIVLTIPSFDTRHKAAIDALIEDRGDALRDHELLVLDLRRNMGGSDASFAGLLPPLQTGPIHTIGWDFLAGPETYEQLARTLTQLEGAGEDPGPLGPIVARMREHPGEIVHGIDDFETAFTGAWPNPQEVAIVYDRDCASSCEQFLLAARQSDKVVLMGEASSGTLDYSNNTVHTLPSERRTVGLPISRSRRLPMHPINGVGVAPDVRIDADLLRSDDPHLLVAFVESTVQDPPK